VQFGVLAQNLVSFGIIVEPVAEGTLTGLFV